MKVDLVELEHYRQSRYIRSRRRCDDPVVFDHSKGLFSIAQTAKLLRCDPQKIYYATRVGYLKAHRLGISWVIHIDDIKAYWRTYLLPRGIVGDMPSPP